MSQILQINKYELQKIVKEVLKEQEESNTKNNKTADGCDEVAMEVAEALGFTETEKQLVCEKYPAPDGFGTILLKELAEDFGTGVIVHLILESMPFLGAPSGKKAADFLKKIDVGGRFGSILNVGYYITGLYDIYKKATWKDSPEHNEMKKRANVAMKNLYKDLKSASDLVNKEKGDNFSIKSRQQLGKTALELVYKFEPGISIASTGKPRVSFKKLNNYVRKIQQSSAAVSRMNFGGFLLASINIFKKEFTSFSDDDFKSDKIIKNFIQDEASGQKLGLSPGPLDYTVFSKYGRKPAARELIRIRENPEILMAALIECLDIRGTLSLELKDDEKKDFILFINALYKIANSAFDPRGEVDEPVDQMRLNKIFMYSTLVNRIRKDILDKLKQGTAGEITKDAALLTAEVLLFTRAGFIMALAGIVVVSLIKDPDLLKKAFDAHKGFERELNDVIRLTNDIETKFNDSKYLRNLYTKSLAVDEKIEEFESNLVSYKNYFSELLVKIGQSDEFVKTDAVQKANKAKVQINKIQNDFTQTISRADLTGAAQEFDFKEVRFSDLIFKMYKSYNKEERLKIYNANSVTIKEKIQGYKNVIDFFNKPEFQDQLKAMNEPGFNRSLTNSIAKAVKSDKFYAPFSREAKENNMSLLKENTEKDLDKILNDPILKTNPNYITQLVDANPAFGVGFYLAQAINEKSETRLRYAEYVSKIKTGIYNAESYKQLVLKDTRDFKKLMVARKTTLGMDRKNNILHPQYNKFFTEGLGVKVLIDIERFFGDTPRVLLISNYRDTQNKLKLLQIVTGGESNEIQAKTLFIAWKNGAIVDAGGPGPIPPAVSSTSGIAKAKSDLNSHRNIIVKVNQIHKKLIASNEKYNNAMPAVKELTETIEAYVRLLTNAENAIDAVNKNPTNQNIINLGLYCASLTSIIGTRR